MSQHKSTMVWTLFEHPRDFIANWPFRLLQTVSIMTHVTSLSIEKRAWELPFQTTRSCSQFLLIEWQAVFWQNELKERLAKRSQNEFILLWKFMVVPCAVTSHMHCQYAKDHSAWINRLAKHQTFYGSLREGNKENIHITCWWPATKKRCTFSKSLSWWHAIVATRHWRICLPTTARGSSVVPSALSWRSEE